MRRLIFTPECVFDDFRSSVFGWSLVEVVLILCLVQVALMFSCRLSRNRIFQFLVTAAPMSVELCCFRLHYAELRRDDPFSERRRHSVYFHRLCRSSSVLLWRICGL